MQFKEKLHDKYRKFVNKLVNILLTQSKLDKKIK
jgi:hypothetical protein